MNVVVDVVTAAVVVAAATVAADDDGDCAPVKLVCQYVTLCDNQSKIIIWRHRHWRWRWWK